MRARASPPSARRDPVEAQLSLQPLSRIFGSGMRICGIFPAHVRMFAPIRPDGHLSLRTHVPTEHYIPAHAPSALRALPGPLVPLARGRLHRRLGGRPGRARPGRLAWAGGCGHRAPPTPGPAAWEIRSATTGPADPDDTLLRVPGRPCDVSEPDKGATRSYKEFELRITIVHEV